MRQRLALWMWQTAIRIEPTIAWLTEQHIRQTVMLEQQAQAAQLAEWRQAVAVRAARQ